MDKQLNEEVLQDLYAWIDKIPLSRPKRNITRDFSDGVMTAEVVKHFLPKLVDLHNYTPANSTPQKLCNWATLNRKVFSKLNFHVPDEILRKIVVSSPGFIEPVLCALRQKIQDKRLERATDYAQDLEYYTTTNEHSQTEKGGTVSDTTPVKLGPVRKTEKHSSVAVLGSSVDPTVRLLVEEKERALLALQETVEILQIKVNKLEHLVHLKDMRIEDLSRHLDRYKTGANMS
ncbi:sperm flagellar protein 1 [Chanos chanos]|uniref:Sperm flagellar protein 1 n=1 Tax=Chanos chanos TaxID=29144 RepID=A0A6J2V7M2_CHACN|nr:sperm flagellar protein 1 [Chanos chanos]